jgi:hypothetical protein
MGVAAVLLSFELSGALIATCVSLFLDDCRRRLPVRASAGWSRNRHRSAVDGMVDVVPNLRPARFTAWQSAEFIGLIFKRKVVWRKHTL